MSIEVPELLLNDDSEIKYADMFVTVEFYQGKYDQIKTPV